MPLDDQDISAIHNAVQTAMADLIGKFRPLPAPHHPPHECPVTEVVVRTGLKGATSIPGCPQCIPPVCPTPAATLTPDTRRKLEQMSQKRGVSSDELLGQLTHEAISQLVSSVINNWSEEQDR